LHALANILSSIEYRLFFNDNHLVCSRPNTGKFHLERPWILQKDDNDHKSANVQKKAKKKLYRLEKEFSQVESQSSQATTVIQDTPTEPCSSSQDIPNGTVYFSDGISESIAHDFNSSESVKSVSR
jgi:hypothetical protein